MSAATQAADLPQLLESVDPDRELAPCALHHLVLGAGTAATLADVVADLLGESAPAGRRARVTLLVDATAIHADGPLGRADVKADAVRALEGRYDVVHRVLDDGHAELHVTDDVVAQAAAACAGADVVVALGGGTISDIGKLAAVASPPAPAPVLVTVQTAASVDGYTDDVSVVLRDGVKRTVPSRWPDAVIADDAVVAGAPAAMTRAGYGEMTSMLVAPADWRLAALVGVDTGYRPAAIRLLRTVGADLASWSAGVREGRPEAVAVLTRALALRGVVTGVAGSTAVLSGVEHLVSHMLDQHRAAAGRPIGLHGAQVGVGGVLAAAAWELCVERLDRGGARLDPAALDADRARVLVGAAFDGLGGKVSLECWRDYDAKLTRVQAHADDVAALAAGWPEHRDDLLAHRVPSRELAGNLVRAGAAVTGDELDPAAPEDLLRWALGSCYLMRNRFTVVDLLVLLGWWTDDDVEEVMGRARASVAAAREEEARHVR